MRGASKNIAYSYINRASALLAGLALVPLFTRLLGPRLYGELLVIFTITMNLSLANLGIDQTLTNRIAEANATGKASLIRALLSTAFYAYTVIAAALVLVLALWSPWLCRKFVSQDDRTAADTLLVVGTFTALALPFRTYLILLRGLGRVNEEQRIGACSVAARAVGIALALACGLKLLAIAIIHGAATLGAGLAGYLRARTLLREIDPSILRFSYNVLRSLAAPSLGFAVLQVAGAAGFGIDNLIIGYILGPEQVTKYAVAFSLIMVGITLFSTLTGALLPSITALYAEQNVRLLTRMLSVTTRLALLYGGAGAAGLWIAGPWIVRWWAGPQIYPGDTTFGLLVLLFVTQIMIEPPWMVLVATTRHYGPAAMHVAESALNVALSVWWARTWGLPGVIAGTLVARLITSAWYIPFAAARTLHYTLARVANALAIPAMLTAGSLIAAFLFLGRDLRASAASPIMAAIVLSIFGIVFSFATFSREERRAGLNWATTFIRGR